MHSSDDTNPTPEKKARWKKCPICFDSIYISETRPVRWFIGQEGERPQEGCDVVLRLILRQPGSTLALPRDGAEALTIADEIPWHFAAEVMDYARVMKGSEDYIIEQYENEIEELQQQEKEDELMFGEETQWTKKAVHAISEAKEKAKDIGKPPSRPQQPSQRKTKRPPIQYLDSEGTPEFYHIQHAAKSGQSIPNSSMSLPSSDTFGSSANQSRRTTSSSSGEDVASQITASTSASKSMFSETKTSKPSQASSHQPTLHRHHVDPRSSNASTSQPNDSPFYFYEALLHYYLSPLDIRILRAAFGDFSSFPATILPRVEHVSTGHIVDDDLRRKAKYLAHLPHGCEVGFLECDWTDVVVPEVLEGFTEEIARRRKRKREKEVREEKERVRAEKEEDDKRWAAARRRRPTPSQDVISESDFQPLPDRSSADFAASSPPWSSSRMQGGSGFASLASPSTSPVGSKTVWGTTLIIPPSPVILPIPDELEQAGNDGWLQDWERDLLAEEDLAAQIEATTLEASSSRDILMAGNGKKKKAKKITLMSTNARRGA